MDSFVFLAARLLFQPLTVSAMSLQPALPNRQAGGIKKMEARMMRMTARGNMPKTAVMAHFHVVKDVLKMI